MVDKIVRCAEDKGWKVDVDFKQGKGLTLFEFSQYTPAGQDFSFTATMENNQLDNLIIDMEEYSEGFDVDSEAYLWLDCNGHGKNGAPYRMREVLDDMEEAKKMIKTLLDAIKTL